MILVNGNQIAFDGPVTVTTLIKRMNYSHPLLIVKINGAFIHTEEYEDAMVRDGDEVQIIHLMTGG